MALNVPVSLEFFPPRTLAGIENLAAERQKLYALQPDVRRHGAEIVPAQIVPILDGE